jgi:hypothetical protein
MTRRRNGTLDELRRNAIAALALLVVVSVGATILIAVL